MKKLLSFLAVAALSTGLALAQTQNGTVTGVVTDSTGAVVAGALVTLSGVNTGVTRTAKTDSAGVYDIEGVKPEDYKVTVAAAGFATTTTAPFHVAVGSDNKVNAKVSVQQNSETVEVAANSLAGINLENAEQSQVINSEQITELPTETRNPYALTNLSAFATVDPTGTNRGTGVALGGARSASTEILLDGLENTGLFSVGVATTVPLDAVQEYRVITSNYGPEYGRASGGVVNVATRAGTNSLHGTLWEFYRPSTFVSQDSYNRAQGLTQGRFVRNEFGFVVGGPIIKDKLFFFGGNEWLRVRSSQQSSFVVPTSQFISMSNANTQGFFNAYGKLAASTLATYTLQDITTKLGANSAVAYNSAWSTTDRANLLAAGFTDATPMFQKVAVTTFSDAGGGTPQNTYNPIGRLDFNMTDKTQMYGRYVLFNESTPVGANTVSPYQGYSTGFSIKTQNLVYGLTHTFNSHWTSQVELGLLRYNNNAPLGDNPVGPTMFVNGTTFKLGSTGNNVVFPGYVPTSASTGLPSGGPQNDIQVFPVFTYTKGRHTQTFGGQYTYIRDNHTFPIYSNAQEALVVSGSAGALTNFQQGVFNYFQANINSQNKYPCAKSFTTGATPGIAGQGGTPAFDPTCTITTPITQPVFGRSNRYQEFALFYNEEWKATPRLTINAGLRYEVYGTQHNKNPNLDSNFYPGTTGSVFDRYRAGKILRTTDTAPAGVQNPNGKLWRTNYKQFAPRLGFAYDVFGNGKTSLRGGYGISYERNFGNVTYNVALNPPGQFAISLTNADNNGVSFPISTGAVGPFSSAAGIQKALPQATVRAVDPNIKPAYMEFYDLAIEHQINPTLSVGLAYQGARGIHGYSIANYNRLYYGQIYENDPATYTLATGSPSANPYTGVLIDNNRLNNQYTSINVRGSDADSHYDALNVSVRGANIYHSHLTVTTNYTFGHSLDDLTSTFDSDGGSNGSLGAGGIAYFDPFNKMIDYGNADNDVKHRVAIGLVYTTPAFGTKGLVKTLIGGFEIGTQYVAQTGQPFTMYDTGLPTSGNGVYARARFATPVPHQRTGPSQALGSNIYDYIDFPTRVNTDGSLNNTNYVNYRDPRSNVTTRVCIANCTTTPVYQIQFGASDLPASTSPYDSFGFGQANGGMSARNSFRGPGFQTFNADLIKNFRFRERYNLQLRAEAYNVLNHQNEAMTFGSTNDVDGPIGPNGNAYAQTYKDAQRQLQLAAKVTF